MWDTPEDEDKKQDPTQLYVPEDSPSDLKRKEAIKGYYQDAWRKKQMDLDGKVDSAKSASDMGAYADIAGDLLTNYNNSQKQPVQLPNRLQDLGKKADTIDPTMEKWNSVAPMMDKKVAEAKSAKEDAYKGFKQDIDLQSVDTDISDKNVARDRTNQTYDANSNLSKMSQVLARSSLQSKAKEAEMAGDPDAAAQLRAVDTSKMSAQEAKTFADSLKNTSYADVLKSQDDRAKITSASQDRAATRENTAAMRDIANQGRVSDKQDKADEKMEQLRVGDLGYAQTAEDAKVLKTATESKAQFDNQLDEL